MLRLGALLDARWRAAARASGGLSGERTMLYVALMLADALDEAGKRPPPEDTGDAAGEAVLDRLADRLEALATALER